MQWVTRDAGKPQVRWGTARGRLEHAAPGDSSTYTAADLCGAPANTSGWMDPGWLHGAVMAGLQPSTRYWYQYGDEVCERCVPPRGCVGWYGRGMGVRALLLVLLCLGPPIAGRLQLPPHIHTHV